MKKLGRLRKMTEDMDQGVLVLGTGSGTSKSDSYVTMNIIGLVSQIVMLQ